MVDNLALTSNDKAFKFCCTHALDFIKQENLSSEQLDLNRVDYSTWGGSSAASCLSKAYLGCWWHLKEAGNRSSRSSSDPQDSLINDYHRSLKQIVGMLNMVSLTCRPTLLCNMYQADDVMKMPVFVSAPPYISFQRCAAKLASWSCKV